MGTDEHHQGRKTSGPLPPAQLDADDLRALLALGESETVEFKRTLPSAEELQRLIAAFANTEGGTLIIGVDDDGEPIGLAHPGTTAWHAEEWIKGVTPRPDVRISGGELEPGKHLVVVHVAPGGHVPYLAGGQAVMRRGTRITPLSAEHIVSRIEGQALDAEIRQLAEAVSAQSTTITDLSRRMHWKRQVPIRFGAAIIGATVGYLLATWNPL